MICLRVSLRIGVLFCAIHLLASCASHPRVDTRPIEQQLADRPAPTFSAEQIAAFAAVDGAKPFRLTSFLRGCAPLAPPVRAMTREKTNRVEGLITAVVLPDGLFDSVKTSDVVPESMNADVEAMFVLALKTQPCKLLPRASPLTVEIPFLLRLD